MAAIASIPITLRIRVEAGIGDKLTDVGHVDANVTIPFTASVAEGGRIVLEPGAVEAAFTGLLSDLKASVTADKEPPCTNHRLVQHRDGKLPWCAACRSTAEGLSPDQYPPVQHHALIVESDTGDPICACGFKPTSADASTQLAAATMIRRHAALSNPVHG